MESTKDKSLSQNHVYMCFPDFYASYLFISNFMIFIKINDFENKIVPFGAGGTAGQQLGELSGAAASTTL